MTLSADERSAIEARDADWKRRRWGGYSRITGPSESVADSHWTGQAIADRRLLLAALVAAEAERDQWRGQWERDVDTVARSRDAAEARAEERADDISRRYHAAFDSNVNEPTDAP